MKRIILIQPWKYHDEGIVNHNLSIEWRNGPYNVLCLAAQLNKYGIPSKIIDLQPILIYFKGNVDYCLKFLRKEVEKFNPDFVGISFFSYQVIEAKTIIDNIRRYQKCKFIAGGIHSTIEPHHTLKELGFDYVFVGEGEIGLVKIGQGVQPEEVQGVVTSRKQVIKKGEEIEKLDHLPFPDWKLCNYKFYSSPSSAKIFNREVRSLDLMMGRGCLNRCSFCAYHRLSRVRYYSAQYVIDQLSHMIHDLGINSIYFLDSSVGNNLKLLKEICIGMLKAEIHKKLKWCANMRADQGDEALLQLMWKAGCRGLFYGFESGSQRILNAMHKNCTVEQNFQRAELHYRLKFPYHASILLGYPGENEEDIDATRNFIREIKAPLIGINWYVPLPGSKDFKDLKESGLLKLNCLNAYRNLGESFENKNIYADIEESRFQKLFTSISQEAYANRTLNRDKWISSFSAC
jgi:anaerobic magnesium-protoporphyrin IX monomethyl ester cyclase